MTISGPAFPVLLASFLLFASAHLACAGSLFTFETNTTGTAAPFTDTLNGLSATFGGHASVCDSAEIFQSLSGNVLIQGVCGPSSESGPLSVLFSANLTRVALNFATAGGAGTLSLTAFENATTVGTLNFTSTVPTGEANGEGLAGFSGEAFNRVTLSSTSLLAIDNVNAQSAVPEPSALLPVFGGLGLLVVFARRKRRC